MYHSILVPLDGSVFAEWALPTAVSIARTANAKLELLIVDTPVNTFGVGLATAEVEIGAGTHLALYVEAIAERIANTSGVSVEAAVRVGAADKTIIRHAHERACDIIVMATHGRGQLRRLWLGSVATEVVRQSGIPVLLVRPTRGQSAELSSLSAIRNILVPLDGSEFSEEVLPYAVELGVLWSAAYTFLSVLEPQRAGVPDAFTVPPSDSLFNEEAAQAHGYLHRVAGRFAQRQVHAETVIAVENHAPTAILKFARRSGCDLIAMTTHGRSGVGRLLLGSVADKVLRGAASPVLLYRPRGA